MSGKYQLVFVVVLWGAIGLFLASSLNQRAHFERGAIERGYGQWCPTTGLWAWKGECEG